jgi:hypothetical protein
MAEIEKAENQVNHSREVKTTLAAHGQSGEMEDK